MYGYLKASGRVPRRFASGEESTDLLIAGLREYVLLLEKENRELRAENDRLKRPQQQQAG